jgi:hypothetical protein
MSRTWHESMDRVDTGPAGRSRRARVGQRLAWVLATAGLLLPTACGTGVDGLFSGLGLVPDASSISLDVRDACDGVMTEQEMIGSILAARVDRANGITKSEEQVNAIQGCAADALTSGVDYDACMTCKEAILDQVFGG